MNKNKICDVKILSLERKDINNAVDIHLHAFPGFFLSFLGKSFLRQYYLAVINDESGISFVARDVKKESVIGSILGTTSPEGFYRRLAVRKWWKFGWASLGAVLRNPRILNRLLRALRYRGDAPEKPGFVLLSSIAVAPEAQGRGIGKALLLRWLEEAKKRSCMGAYLTTDAFDNDIVNDFYLRNGWSLDCTYSTPEGRAMKRYIMTFQKEGL